MKKTDVTTEVSELKKGTVDLIPEELKTNKVSEARVSPQHGIQLLYS